jgi:hypothetical protein
MKFLKIIYAHMILYWYIFWLSDLRRDTLKYVWRPTTEKSLILIIIRNLTLGRLWNLLGFCRSHTHRYKDIYNLFKDELHYFQQISIFFWQKIAEHYSELIVAAWWKSFRVMSNQVFLFSIYAVISTVRKISPF